MNKQKTICLTLIVLLVFGAFLGMIFIKGERIADSVACIYSDSELIKTIELHNDDDYTFVVTNKDGKENTVQVKNGTIGVISADCPDKICVNTPHISDGLQPVVCMPNHLVIHIEAKRPESK